MENGQNHLFQFIISIFFAGVFLCCERISAIDIICSLCIQMDVIQKLRAANERGAATNRKYNLKFFSSSSSAVVVWSLHPLKSNAHFFLPQTLCAQAEV